MRKRFAELRSAIVDSAATFAIRHVRDAPLIYDALLVAEDHRGRRHLGIDGISIARAILVAPCVGRICAVSTIEQQVVRVVHPRARRDWQTKLEELFLARALAKACSKETIWAAYLQVAYYGAAGDYAKTRAAFAPSDAQLTPRTASQIVACLKYPLRSVYDTTGLLHAARAAHVEGVLRSGLRTWRARLADRHRSCVRAALQRLRSEGPMASRS